MRQNIKGVIMANSKPILTVCCICGICYKSGVLAQGKYVSHGYCPKREKIQMDLIEKAMKGGRHGDLLRNGN